MKNALVSAVYVRYLVARRGGVEAARWLGVSVGKNCRIYSFHFGTEPWLIAIGNDVTVSSGVHFLTHDGVGWLKQDESGRRYRFGRITVGSHVFIGLGTIIMPGVTIGSRCVVGAGSVVTKSIPDDLVVAGNPARVVCSFSELMARVESWPIATLSSETDYQAFTRELSQNVAAPTLEAGASTTREYIGNLNMRSCNES